jgi:hypothetical protein
VKPYQEWIDDYENIAVNISGVSDADTTQIISMFLISHLVPCLDTDSIGSAYTVY